MPPKSRAPKKASQQIEKLNNRLEQLQIEYVPINSLQPNDYNPNRQSEHEFELLRRSITEDGFTQPIIVNRTDQKIVDGEHRWRMAGELGYETVPVVFVDYTEARRRIATLRHNRARGSEDVGLSAAVLRDLRELGALDWAQDSLMMDEVELSTLLEDIPVSDALAAQDYANAWEVVDTTEQNADGERVAASVTPAAITQRRRAEQAAANAATEADRKKAREESRTFTVSCVFSSEEADVVKKVLGNKQAEKLLELCRAYLEANPSK